MRPNTISELLDKVAPQCDGCWLWQASKDRNGYGRALFAGRQLTAHRAVYEQLVGPIPAGLELDHLCRVTSCVCPDHLEPVTPGENMRRRFVLITHCKYGHEYTPENTYWSSRGHRSCRACKTLRGKARYAGVLPRTHCPQGHPYDEANTYQRPAGQGRHCRICQAAASRRHRARKKELAS